jgi:hypothetical protein
MNLWSNNKFIKIILIFFIDFRFLLILEKKMSTTTNNLKVIHYFGSSQVLIDEHVNLNSTILDYFQNVNKVKTQLPILRLYIGTKFKSTKVWDYSKNPKMTFQELFDLVGKKELYATVYGETFSFDHL